MRKHPGATLLPLLVTQLPFAIATGAVFFYLHYEAYPQAAFGSWRSLSEAPNGLRLTMLLLAAGQSLFSLVGGAATIVAVEALVRAKQLSLAQALDPAFTRMGGLLVFGLFFNVLILASFIGLFVLLYFVVRFGTVLQAYMVDGTSIGGAFGAGWRQMRGRMFRLMTLLLTAVPLAVVLLLALGLILSLVAAPFGAELTRTEDLAIQSLAVFLGGALLVPVGAYLATSTTLFYLSSREPARA
jgi:hypothetical protein